MASGTSHTDTRENALLRLFLEWPPERGPAEEHIDEILHQFEAQQAGYDGDQGQMLKVVAGKGLQKLVRVLVEDVVGALNQERGLALRCTSADELSKLNSSPSLDLVKRNLLIDYGPYGMHLPDADVVLYHAETLAVVCIVSCKTSLRDRLKQTAYWKLKLQQNPHTHHIRVCLMTPDKDRTLVENRYPPRKNYAIASADLDATYLLRPSFDATAMIKPFTDFASDVSDWMSGPVGGGGGGGGVSGCAAEQACGVGRGSVPGGAGWAAGDPQVAACRRRRSRGSIPRGGANAAQARRARSAVGARFAAGAGQGRRRGDRR